MKEKAKTKQKNQTKTEKTKGDRKYSKRMRAK